MTKPHALIIDDNAQNLEVLARLLESNNVGCTALQDTRNLETDLQALASLDLVFLDLEMPLRNGYEVLKLLRTHYGTGLPIIACTVHTSELSSVREMGFDGFIAKPLNPLQFSKQIARLLNGESVWDPW